MLGSFHPKRKCMEFCMRDQIYYTALGVALLAGTSLAQAQTVETVITPQPGPAVIAPPATVVQAAPTVETMPVQATETVRTVRSTTTPRRHPLAKTAPVGSVTTTTTVRERVVPEPIGAVPVVVQAPAVSGLTYPAPLYDVVPAPGIVPPAVVAQPVIPVPAYRYVYQPDRILVIDANTGIAVQAIPR
jgi:hypothetical protein